MTWFAVVHHPEAVPPRRARKRFGQHYLVDDLVIERIVELIAPTAGERILEIGPGGGVLTAPLVASGALLTAIEIDRDLAASLTQRFAHCSNFTLINADVLRVDLGTLAATAGSWKAVGNLPYNISTPLIMQLLEHADLFSEMTFMLQREVAARMTAAPDSRAYGRLSIMAQRRAELVQRLQVGPDSFDPPPKVDSSVIQLRPRREHRDPAFEQRLDQLVRGAFAARRKTIGNALRQILASAVFDAAGIDPRRRAETLSITDYECLARISLTMELK